MKRLAIVTTHPIQYYAPVFQLLAARGRIEIKVFYSWGERVRSKFDPGFARQVSWDIPVLQGYSYAWADNIAPDPGTHHYRGIDTPGLVRQVLDWDPDAVLVFGWSWRGHLQAMRFFKGRIPVFFRGDSTVLSGGRGVKGIMKLLFLRWVYRHVDLAFYVGSNNRAYFKKYGLRDDQLVFAPHAIDNERFRQDPAVQADELRSSAGLKPDDMLVLFAGKFEPVKNVELLVSAFLQLNRPGVHLLLVGNGPLEDSLKAAAAGNPNIHFMDFQNQLAMPAVYRSADLFCLPSVSETWGLAVNEAMACGRAVLVSDQVGCAADLVSAANGAVFRSGSCEDLVRQMKELLTSRERLAAMGGRSAETISAWNFERIAGAIEKQLGAGEKN